MNRTSNRTSGAALALAVSLSAMLAPAVFAQAAAPQGTDPTQPAQIQRPGCPAQGQEHASATPPAQGPNSGTQPGGSGSTGWSGGTGGSFIGTSASGKTEGSPNAHPETVTGLDPKVGPSRTEC